MGFVFTLILFAATLLLSELLKKPPAGNSQRPAGLGDFNFPTATEGRPVPIIWGTVKLEGPNVIWYDDLRPEPITQTQKTGLFSKKKVRVGYRYYLGLQMALCSGEIDSLLRIWVDDEVLWDTGLSSEGTIEIDAPDFFGGESNGQGGLSGTLSVRLGTSTQTSPTYLDAFQGVGGVTPGYRKVANVTAEAFYFGTSTTVSPWAFECRRIPNGLGLATPSVNDGNDANHMNVIFELLTDTEWGLGFPSSDVDTAKFSAAAEVLRLEGNGFSFVLDQQREVWEIIQEIQQQIDGVVFLNRLTGKWDIKLARADYDIDLVPQLTPANLIEINDYTRGSWAETQNLQWVQFFSREREYQETFAAAQDMANMRNQGGQLVKAQRTYPGVKDSDLANQIAWRELRTGSYPFAKANVIVDRNFSLVNPGDVIAWTEPDLGFTKLPMRITRIDLGELDKGQISLDLVQDVFTAVTPSFSSPGGGDWTAPTNTVVDIPVGDRKFFEAPKAFTDRDPELPGVTGRVWCGLRNQGDGALAADIVGTVSGDVVGDLGDFLLAGQLSATLEPEFNTNDTITLVASPDNKGLILSRVNDVTASDIGNSLANLILINDEFLGFTGAEDGGGSNVTLTGVVRGLLDSAPPVGGHAGGTRVWFLSIGGTLTDSTFTGSSISLKPLTQSLTDTLLVGDATATVVSLDDRGVKPYPPIDPQANGSTAYGAGPHSLDEAGAVAGTGDNGFGIDFSFTRRDFRLSDEYNKLVDESTLPSDFPAANTTEYRLEVREDPSGSNTLLFTTDWDSENDPGVSRNLVLYETDGVVPSDLRVTVETRHTVNAVVYESIQNLVVDMAVNSSALSGLTNLGALATSVVSSGWSAPTTGTYNVDIFDQLPNGALEVQINGGGWSTVITGASTTGTFSATAADTIEFRHSATSSPDQYFFMEVSPPSSGTDAYAILRS